MNGFKSYPQIQDSRKEWKRRCAEMNKILGEMKSINDNLLKKMEAIDNLLTKSVFGLVSAGKLKEIIK